MSQFYFTVTFQGKIEAPDADTARTWAVEDVEAGRHPVVDVEVEPVTRKEPAQ